jgi:hypothetical protein
MENVAIDPLAGVPADASHEVARDHAAVIVKGRGVTIEQANAALVARGAAPLTANSAELAEATRDALINDSDFAARYLRGDPEAVSQLYQADLRVQQSNGKLTDRNLAPTDYNNLKVAPHMPDAKPDNVKAYGEDLAKLGAAIQLPEKNLQSLTDAHFNAMKTLNGMTADEASMYGQRQVADLHAVLGADAEAQIAAATKTLTDAGRPLDIAKIAASNSAEVALILVHQAQVLARQKR